MDTITKQDRVAKAAFVFGTVATLSINLAHAEPNIGAKALSLVAPICVLFAVELLLLAPKPESERLARVQYAGIGLIGLAALVISYVHTAELFMRYGESTLLSWIAPLIPDGMMVFASIALINVASLKAQAKAKATAKAERAAKRANKPVEAQKQSDGSTPAQATKNDAQMVVRTALIDGKTVSAKELAYQFGRSESWARRQIKMVKDEQAAA